MDHPPPVGSTDKDEQDGILDVFRRATAGRHAAIEDLLELRSAFDRTHYARILQGFASFLGQWEPRMAAVLPERLQPMFERGRRLHLLQQDLVSMDLPPSHGAALEAPELATLAQALGSLYVMEGSALGGQFISAHVQRHLGITPEDGSAYFHGAGRGTAERWREVRALLAEELQDDATASASAVQSAQDTFDALTRTFQDLLHDRAAA